MEPIIDKLKFGPWALITGASSGIGLEFARQLAVAGLNLILVARRQNLLEEIGKDLVDKYGIRYKAVDADLSKESSIDKIVEATKDLEIGLLISNAGTGRVGRFFSFDVAEHKYIVHLNAVSHLSLTHHFGGEMAKRRRGGVLLTGAMGASDGVPYMSNEAGTKGYIQSLGQSLHTEFKEFGLHLTVLVTTPTETPVFYKLGFTKSNTPVQPISVEQCVRESLIALGRNKMTVVPGLKFRMMHALTPGFMSRKMAAKIMKKNNGL